MTVELALLVLGIALLGLASVFAVASLVRPFQSGERRILVPAAIGILFLLAVLAIHGFHARRIPAFGRFEALTCYGIAVIAAYMQMASRHHMRGISGIVIPYVTVLLVLAAPSVNVVMVLPAKMHHVWLGLHVCTAFVGYALFTLASVLAFAYLIQDNNLKRKHFGILFERLPSLEVLDQLMYRQIGIAFLFFTISIAFGVHLARLSGAGQEWITDPKIAATIATWVIYGVLLHLRANADRHGRKVALVTLAGLVFVLFTFYGVHFIADSVHAFVLPEAIQSSP